MYPHYEGGKTDAPSWDSAFPGERTRRPVIAATAV